MKDELGVQRLDHLVSTVKAAAGFTPLGGLLSEVVGVVIPQQRMDRLVAFARELDARLENVKADLVKLSLANEHFSDLLEESVRQAARSLSQERREYIA